MYIIVWESGLYYYYILYNIFFIKYSIIGENIFFICLIIVILLFLRYIKVRKGYVVLWRVWEIEV